MVRIGEISSGTFRPQDLLRTFADTLRDIWRVNVSDGTPDFFALQDALKLCVEAHKYADILDRGEEFQNDNMGASYEGYDDDFYQANGLIGELVDALNDHAPVFCYFGTVEGDGASFGFWPISDLSQCYYDGELEQRDELPPDHIAVVNDHGNVSVYSVEYTLVWDCV